MTRRPTDLPTARAELRQHAKLISEAHHLLATGASRADIAHFAETIGRDSIARSIARVARYIERLSGSGGALQYEEMHKLFSLVDDLHSLLTLISEDQAVPQPIREAVAGRLQRQSRTARLVAEDRATPEHRARWPYRDLLARER